METSGLILNTLVSNHIIITSAYGFRKYQPLNTGPFNIQANILNVTVKKGRASGPNCVAHIYTQL